MKFLILSLFSLSVLCSCSTISSNHTDTVSLNSVGSMADKINTHVTNSSGFVSAAITSLDDVEKQFPPTKPYLTLVDNQLSRALFENNESQKEIALLRIDLNEKQGEVDRANSDRNKLSDDLNTLKLKSAKQSTGILRLWIAIGGLLTLVGSYIYLRLQFPFLKLI